MAALGAGSCIWRLGDLEPELEQFTMDARGAPQWVLLAHPLDEFAQLTANSRPFLVEREVSSANRPETRRDATAESYQAERRGINRAGLATAKSSTPSTPGHSHEAVDGAVHPSAQY
jgi:hypothetical protein